MSVTVVVPWRAGCEYRERNWRWVQARFASRHPSWEVVTGESPDGPFNRAAAILDGARRAQNDVLVIADADCWTDLGDAVASLETWAVPHRLLHRLSAESSLLFMGGAPLDGLRLDGSNRQDSRPYVGNETGTMLVIRRDVLFDVPPDVRFVGWGQEDEAWSIALRCLVGEPWRGDLDLVHLWHPAQPRKNRVIGSDASRALKHRYVLARKHPDHMRDLIGEAA